jgi:DNA invertase Pin-like site-specific DNA recombinase
MQIVTYLRVSTAKQGMTGLGMEAQRTAVEGFALSGGHRIVAEFVEVESGKKTDRPQLEAALAACRLHRATLVIAKLDRLARNVAFIANLMDGGVEFVACDMPYANRLTLHLMAAMAEHEREMISQRTKAALAAAKARGVKLGNPNSAAHLLAGCRAAARKGEKARQANGRGRDEALLPLLAELASEGIVSASATATALNLRGIPSPTGGIWYPQQTRRLLSRLQP